MEESHKRKTILPHSLWDREDQSSDRNRSQQNITRDQSPSITKEQPFDSLQTLNEKPPPDTKSTRFGIPIKPSPPITSTNGLKQDRYRKFCKIDQAGPGVIAILDIETFPVYLIKESPQSPKGLKALKKAHHDNLVGLIDAFESGGTLHVVYEYEHLAVSLACAVGSVEFSEPDMATICREVLHGVVFLHTTLKIAHGAINCSNIILTHRGGVKIANIGDSLLNQSSISVKEDLKAVSSILLYLGDRKNLLCDSSHDVQPPNLSRSALSFMGKSGEYPADLLLKHEFLQLANPGGAWSLKRHYFDTFPVGIKIGERVDNN